jgi:hypothetical protein
MNFVAVAPRADPGFGTQERTPQDWLNMLAQYSTQYHLRLQRISLHDMTP